MANKFRQRGQQQPIPPKARTHEPQGDLEAYRGEKSEAILPLTTASISQHVKIEKGELRKDVGWAALGTPIGTIIGLFEHKWQFGGEVYARVLRIFNEGGLTRSQYWDGLQWVESAQATEPMEDVYLSEVSIQGCFVVADGRRIMAWCEEIETTEYGHDFLAGLILAGPLSGQCTDEIVVDPGGAVGAQYYINLSIEWINIPTTKEGVVTLLVYHNGFQFTTKVIRYSPGTSPSEARTLQDKTLPFRRVMTSGDTFWLCISPTTADVFEDYIDIPLTEVDSDIPTFNMPVPQGLQASRHNSLYVALQWSNTVGDAEIQIWFNDTGVIPGDEVSGTYTIYTEAPGATQHLSNQLHYDLYTPRFAGIRYHRGNEYSPWVFYWGVP